MFFELREHTFEAWEMQKRQKWGNVLSVVKQVRERGDDVSE